MVFPGNPPNPTTVSCSFSIGQPVAAPARWIGWTNLSNVNAVVSTKMAMSLALGVTAKLGCGTRVSIGTIRWFALNDPPTRTSRTSNIGLAMKAVVRTCRFVMMTPPPCPPVAVCVITYVMCVAYGASSHHWPLRIALLSCWRFSTFDCVIFWIYFNIPRSSLQRAERKSVETSCLDWDVKIDWHLAHRTFIDKFDEEENLLQSYHGIEMSKIRSDIKNIRV